MQEQIGASNEQLKHLEMKINEIKSTHPNNIMAKVFDSK